MAAEVDELARNLSHANRDVRLAAAAALAQHADLALAVGPLVSALRDADPEVRHAAAEALKQLARVRRERLETQQRGISPGLVALKGAQSLGCLIQLIFGLLALVALVLKIFVDLNR